MKSSFVFLGCAALSAALLIDCSGGAQPTPPVAPAISVTATPTATAAPTASPTTASTATASPTPTIAPVLVLQAAPLTSTPTILAKSRRAQSGTSLLPLMVQGGGLTIAPMAVWVTDAATGHDVAETTGSVTGATFAPLACPNASTLWCAVHPLAWQLTPPTGLATGQHSLAVVFADGTSGSMTDDVYDSWTLPCGTGWVYAGGAIVPTTTRAASDVFEDCAGGNVVFVHAAILASNPVADSFGRLETIMPTITVAINITSAFVNLPIVSVQSGTAFGIQTSDGGFAKVYFTDATHGIALHSQADGTYSF